MKTNEIRELYLNFFEQKQHIRLKSASLVPNNDKSLLIINSGMAPLKPYFIGAQTPPKNRVTTCQKCIRTGDIENVGQTSRHGTFFEMLGNFSFNDYFKEEAILWAYEFCTEVLKLPPEKIYISVYEEDKEAFELWNKKVGIPSEKIVWLGKADNFWEVGVGPCGPCSELYYDRGLNYGCGNANCAPGCDCDRFLEFWNLVFTQFNKEDDGSYSKLDRVNIDTGMGLERMAVIMQSVDSIFEIDTVAKIKEKISEISNIVYGKNQKHDVSIRIITDHIRSITFMISDGILPSNEGRGYVLRRLLRRAVRHGRQINIKEEFLSKIATVVIDGSKYAYPELEEKTNHILNIISNEENNFYKTLDQGTDLLEILISNAKNNNKKIISGNDAFKMYDTYGFPIELMEEILAENNLSIDIDSYNSYMENQKQMARSAREESSFLGGEESIFNTLSHLTTQFIGYNNYSCEADILEIILDNTLVNNAKKGDFISFITSKTPLYPESGGQKGDKGTLKTDTAVVAITDCKKLPLGNIVHFGTVQSGNLLKGKATLLVDEYNRFSTSRNHTATHLLHSALRKVLGPQVEQSGAEKTASKLRFDFSHFGSLKESELEQIQNIVNEKILESIDIEVSKKNIEKAKEEGAIALFGEKYDDIVRVVNIPGFSMELCGGTHVQNTSQIGVFKIISEGGIAQGIRRIEATTGHNTISYFKEIDKKLKKVQFTLKATGENVLQKTNNLISENKDLKAQIESLNSKLNATYLDKLLNEAVTINGKKALIARVDNTSPANLKEMSDQAKTHLKSCVVILIGSFNENVSIVVSATNDIVDSGFKSGEIVKQLAPIVDGGGGGSAHLATAQGKNIHKINATIDMAKNIV